MAEQYPGGSVGPGGLENKVLKDCYNRFLVDSEHLQEELFHWVEWLHRKYPTWGKIREMMVYCLVALYESCSVPLVGIGDIILRLLSYCNLLVVGEVTETCFNPSLCTVLGSGI